MRRMFLLVGLLGLIWGAVGCGPSNEPKKDADGKAAKAPEVPPGGP
jgi:hypothetical protein